MYEITDNEALYCYKALNDFFTSFDNIEDFMLIKKKEFNSTYSDSLDIFGNPLFSDRLFNDYTFNPVDMNFRLEFVETAEQNKIYNTLLNLTSTHTNVTVPGRQLRVIVYETNTNKIVGFIRVNGPTLNMKPRSLVINHQMSDQYDIVNNHIMVGSVIVPTQPFGYNYLGGKLLALLATSNEVREKYKQLYPACDIRFFETTSLYGNIKGMSQYDGLKPYIRNGGFTDSKMVPIPTDAIVHSFWKMFKRFKDENGELFGIATGAVKVKRLTKVYSLVLNKLKEIDVNKYRELKENIEHARDNITTKKLYYYSTYGVGNIKDTLLDQADPVYNIPRERFDMDQLTEWWKKKAQKRFDKLKEEKNDRHELELWTTDSISTRNISVIR